MYASVCKYLIDPGSVEALSVSFLDGLVLLINKLPGFMSYIVIDAGGGVVASVSVFESREAAERSNEAEADWVKENLSDVISDPPEIAVGEIVEAAPRPVVW